MKVGIHIFATDETITVAELASEVEARGFESIWLPEHTHIPTSRQSEWYRGRDLPREYARTVDPYVALATAIATTTKLKLGTGISLVAQHDPIVLAKTIATLDYLSGGRVMFGVGLGWNIEEMVDHGVNPKMRRSTVREKVMSMQGLWSNDTFGYDGKYVQFSESWLWPKPIQPGGPPVIMGGRGGELAYKHIAEFCHGWLPDINMFKRDRLPEMIKELGEACAAIGRNPSEVPVSATGVTADPEVITWLNSIGIERGLFLVPSGGADVVLPLLDKIKEANDQAEGVTS
ncbi:LLM class F420-dependent oxidoreductase [soil metagenome]